MTRPVSSIKVYDDPPPIPGWEQHRFVAVDENSDGKRTGRGPTVAEALRDLGERMDENE